MVVANEVMAVPNGSALADRSNVAYRRWDAAKFPSQRLQADAVTSAWGWGGVARSVEVIRKKAHRSSRLNTAIDLIEGKLGKAEEAHQKYLEEAKRLSDAKRAPIRFDNLSVYDVTKDAHVFYCTTYTPPGSDAVSVSRLEKRVRALKSWDTRRQNEITQRQLPEKLEQYKADNEEANRVIASELDSLSKRSILRNPASKARLNGHIRELSDPLNEHAPVGYGALAILKFFTVDDASTPVVVDHVVESLKKHGLYTTLTSIKDTLDGFVRRSVLPRHGRISQKGAERKVSDAMRLHTLHYAQRVLLEEEPGPGDVSARQIRLSHIKPEDTRAVFDVYKDMAAMISSVTDTSDTSIKSVFFGALDRIMNSPLVGKGGILRLTPDQVTRSAHRTPPKGHRDGTFAGFHMTRPLMLAVMPGVPREVLERLPVPNDPTKQPLYLDTRAHQAIERQWSK